MSLKSLALVCRSLSTMLHSGVSIQKAFEIAGRKTGDRRCRAALNAVADSIRQGNDVAGSMQAQGRYFPELLIDLVRVAENTGALPEILQRLADHYDNHRRLLKNFLSSIIWPVIQLVAAIFIVALVIFIFGIIGDVTNSEPIDILGFGTGAAGAVRWLLFCFGSIAAVVGGYWAAARYFGAKRVLDPLLMRIPVIGGCMRSFAIARFSWAFYLSQEAGMPIVPSLDMSLRVTANGAFMAASHRIGLAVGSGEDLSTAFADSGLFPEEYLQMVHVAETSGTVPEMLDRLSPQFEEDARRSLDTLAMILGWVIWAFVAMLIIFLIFKFALMYIDALNTASGF